MAIYKRENYADRTHTLVTAEGRTLDLGGTATQSEIVDFLGAAGSRWETRIRNELRRVGRIPGEILRTLGVDWMTTGAGRPATVALGDPGSLDSIEAWLAVAQQGAYVRTLERDEVLEALKTAAARLRDAGVPDETGVDIRFAPHRVPSSYDYPAYGTVVYARRRGGRTSVTEVCREKVGRARYGRTPQHGGVTLHVDSETYRALPSGSWAVGFRNGRLD